VNEKIELFSDRSPRSVEQRRTEVTLAFARAFTAVTALVAVSLVTQADLEAAQKGPSVIRERVRLLGGELTIESDPGHGARLEIAVPLSHAVQ
jgi:glucose-6-phosphate-specific signal transduction histidine kinase